MQAAAALADGVQAILRLARGLVSAGRQVDLAGLDHTVGRLCACTLDLPPKRAQAMRPRLIALLAEIDALGAVLPHRPPS